MGLLDHVQNLVGDVCRTVSRQSARLWYASLSIPGNILVSKHEGDVHHPLTLIRILVQFPARSGRDMRGPLQRVALLLRNPSSLDDVYSHVYAVPRGALGNPPASACRVSSASSIVQPSSMASSRAAANISLVTPRGLSCSRAVSSASCAMRAVPSASIRAAETSMCCLVVARWTWLWEILGKYLNIKAKPHPTKTVLAITTRAMRASCMLRMGGRRRDQHRRSRRDHCRTL
uniref:Uncharacterized protein n=1 Tax=uncultured marine virus TaxID=186617 RepID=A0A0F7L229_9VIRU|nr:hypothetical protein [uncultured marine virus]